MWNFRLNDKEFIREVEMLGDVEKIRWYEIKIQTIPGLGTDICESEVYDQDELDELEGAYEMKLVLEMFPYQTII
jgi:hypothetical protein